MLKKLLITLSILCLLPQTVFASSKGFYEWPIGNVQPTVRYSIPETAVFLDFNKLNQDDYSIFYIDPEVNCKVIFKDTNKSFVGQGKIDLDKGYHRGFIITHGDKTFTSYFQDSEVMKEFEKHIKN